MNCRVIVPLVSLVLLVPLPALGQTESKVGGPNVASGIAAIQPAPQERIYEDVEIMRRLLNEKLQRQYAGNMHHQGWKLVAGSNCNSCHQNAHGWLGSNLSQPDGNNLWLDFGVSGALNKNWIGQANPLYSNQVLGHASPLYSNQVLGTMNTLARPNYLSQGLGGITTLDVSGSVHNFPSNRRFDTEGTYLRGHGVVYTLTLPPPERDPRPEPAKPAPKPVTDWERLRREVRREQPKPEEGDKQTKEPTLAEVILKLLAENGQNFSQLGHDETLTVAITFRDTARQLASAAYTDVANSDLKYAETRANGDEQPNPKLDPAKARDPENKPASTAQDYVLLGELHAKQSKYMEAIEAYYKALNLKPGTKQGAAIHQQLAAVYLNAGMLAEAEEALKKARELQEELRKREAKPEKAAAPEPKPLPAKLIISVSKKLLDQVGSGKMSFEKFKKAATVEYVTFAAERK